MVFTAWLTKSSETWAKCECQESYTSPLDSLISVIHDCTSVCVSAWSSQHFLANISPTPLHWTHSSQWSTTARLSVSARDLHNTSSPTSVLHLSTGLPHLSDPRLHVCLCQRVIFTTLPHKHQSYTSPLDSLISVIHDCTSVCVSAWSSQHFLANINHHYHIQVSPEPPLHPTHHPTFISLHIPRKWVELPGCHIGLRYE